MPNSNSGNDFSGSAPASAPVSVAEAKLIDEDTTQEFTKDASGFSINPNANANRSFDANIDYNITAATNHVNANQNHMHSSAQPLPFQLSSTGTFTNSNSANNSNSNSTNVTYPTFDADAIKPRHLHTLEDEHSSYFAVSKACLFFNQLASYGSASITPPTLSSSSSSSSPSSYSYQNESDCECDNQHVIESNLFQPQEYTTQMARILHTLSNTCSHHTDRIA